MTDSILHQVLELNVFKTTKVLNGSVTIREYAVEKSYDVRMPEKLLDCLVCMGLLNKSRLPGGNRDPYGADPISIYSHNGQHYGSVNETAKQCAQDSSQPLDHPANYDKQIEYEQTDHRSDGLTIPTTCVFVVGILAGSGFLALPKSLDDTGWIGIILLLAFCLACIYTSNILGRCWTILLERQMIQHGSHERQPYPLIAELVYGKKAKYLVIVSINFTNFGTIVVYLLLAAQNIELLLSSFFDVSFCYISIIVAGVTLPITWLGSPKEFWGTALAATLATFTASVLVVVNSIVDKSDHPYVEHTNVDFVSFFTAFGTMGFSYGGHPIFPTVQADMKDPRDFGKATFLGYMIVLLIYLPGSITSYFIYGKDVQSNVLFTMSAGPIRTIATVLMTLHLLLGIIIVGNPVCQQVEHLAKIPNKFSVKRVIARTIVMIAALFVAETIPHFSAILALVGGSTITMLAFVLPSLFYLRLCSRVPADKETWRSIYNPPYIWILNCEIMLVGVVAGVAATYSAIHDLATSSFSVPCYVNPRTAQV